MVTGVDGRRASRLDWRAPIAAAAVGAGYVLGSYAFVVAPIEYTVRPLFAVVALGLIVGVIVSPTGRWATFLAVAISSVIVQPDTTVVFALIAAAVWIVGRLRPQRIDISWPALALSVAFCALGIVRVLPSISFPDSPVPRSERSVYLIMLDGYPRIDSLAEHGIDNTPFIEELAARGFDHYPDAHTLHRWTDRTLTALLHEHPEDVPDTASEGQERIAVHAGLRVPEGYVAIAPPVGHVVMRGPTLPIHSVNDFEAFLIGRSMPAFLFPDPLRAWIKADLDRRVTETLDALATTPGPIFAHLMAPHPPFPDGLECWPTCQAFEGNAEEQGITVDEWWRQMGASVSKLNDGLVQAVDEILAAHPDATIVLFSDHGGRPTVDDMDEWYRTLLVARTPGHPRLFEAEPRADTVLRMVERLNTAP